MLHKLKISLITLICLLSSNVAFTLGVGDIKVNSSLNEPLDAEISLNAVRDTEIDNIRINLASRKEFNDAGIDKVLILSDLKFKVVYGDNGKAVVKVFSNKPIREPFLDFLVEVNWPTGRLLREYTMLLDPPVFAQVAAAPKQAPRVATGTAPAAKSVPVYDAKDITLAPAPEELFPRIDISIDETAANLDSSPAGNGTPDGKFTGDTYGPVGSNETLWSIATKVRPDEGVSMDQVLMALLRKNPQAFGNNNINNLNKGQILRIPNRAEIASISQSEAKRLTAEQNALWSSIRDSELAKTPIGTDITGTAPQSGSGTEQDQASVKIITPTSGETGAQGTGTEQNGKAVSQQLALAKEQIASREKENTDLQLQVESLKEQIGSMERLIDLKDESLADLQAKLSDQPQAPVVEQAPEPVAEPVDADVTPPVAEDVTANEEQAPAPVAEEIDVAPEVVAEENLEADAEPEQIALNSNNPYALETAPKTVVPKPPVPPRAPESADSGIMGIITDLLSQPLNIAILLVVVVVLVALAWITINRRRMSAIQFPESILTSGAGAQAGSSGGVSSPTTMDRSATDPTSILSDFAPSAMDTSIETEVGEVDPLSEADVYLAYGKHDQAEDLLRTAVSQEPDRLDLKLKLMEVFHATGNETDFLTLAEQMHSMVDGQSTALWDKAVEMGRELCPESSLFADSLSSDDDFSDLDNIADLDDFEASLDAASAEVDELDLDLPTFETAEESEPEPAPEVEPLSLDIDDMELNPDEASIATAESDMGLGDINLEETSEAAVVADETEFDLGDALDLSAEDDMTADAAPAIDDEMIGIDEVATKLDLAKAYIDMGDPDGARAILDEVAKEGNDAQKSEAEELVSQL